MRSHWIRIGPKSTDRCPYKDRHRDTYREEATWKWRQKLERCRNKSGAPRTAGNSQSLGSVKEGFFPRTLGQSRVPLTPWSQAVISHNCERINFQYFKPLSLWYFVGPRKCTQHANIYWAQTTGWAHLGGARLNFICSLRHHFQHWWSNYD